MVRDRESELDREKRKPRVYKPKLLSFKKENRVIGVSLKVFCYPALAWAKLMESGYTLMVIKRHYHQESAVFGYSRQTLPQRDCVAKAGFERSACPIERVVDMIDKAFEARFIRKICGVDMLVRFILAL